MNHPSHPDSLRRSLLLTLLMACVGCSADAVPEPEPTLESAGAFVATGPIDGNYALFRVLLTLTFDNQQRVLFVLRYSEVPKSIGEARALAQGPQLNGGIVETRVREAFIADGYEVVWFRTLTDEEKDAVL